ncbi:TetR family transcriptional regulator [Leptospira noguchii]|nr:TetR family transcriptional regulator [Leptospira noguchii]
MGSNSLSYPHPKIRVGTQFYREFVVILTDLILRSKYLWVRLW